MIGFVGIESPFNALLSMSPNYLLSDILYTIDLNVQLFGHI